MILIDLPEGVRGRHLTVIIEYFMIKVSLKLGYSFSESDEEGEPITLLRRLLTGLLVPYLPIIPNLCRSSTVEGQLVIVLTKQSPGYWSQLYKDTF